MLHLVNCPLLEGGKTEAKVIFWWPRNSISPAFEFGGRKIGMVGARERSFLSTWVKEEREESLLPRRQNCAF